jgi:hypothetical protein
MNAVVLRRTTIGYINFKPAGRFYEARRVARCRDRGICERA